MGSIQESNKGLMFKSNIFASLLLSTILKYGLFWSHTFF